VSTGAAARGWTSPGREPGLRQQLGLRAAGAGLLAAAGAIHLDLYLTGYRTIPTIGWLFLLQVITAFVLAVAVLVSGSRMVAARRSISHIHLTDRPDDIGRGLSASDI
jgi:hypothetical protein